VKHLPDPIKTVLDDPVDEAMLRRIWEGVDSQLPRRRSVHVRLVLSGAFAGAAIAGLVMLAISGIARRDSGALRLANGGPAGAAEIATATDPLALEMSDGSQIRLEPGARLSPLENSESTFAVVLARGTVRFDVRPGGRRRWIVECGLGTVDVVGTSFSIERTPHRLRVEVERGVVLVRSERVPRHVRRLGAGEAMEITDAAAPPLLPAAGPAPAPTAPVAAEVAAPAEATVAIGPGDAATAAAAGGGAPAATPAAGPAGPLEPRAPVAGAQRRTRGGPTTWRELAEDGRHVQAFSLLGAEGVQRETPRLGVSDLLALADVARLSGHPKEAVAPLERILAEFASDAQAPLAAFALGRLELDALNRPAKAAVAFTRALALGVPLTLKEDAEARLVEAHARAGDRQATAEAARGYARDFPNGRHFETVRRWLDSAP
jgi:transmembrane sensor